VEQQRTLGVARWSGVRRPSLAELYRLHSPSPLRLAYVLVGDNDLAQDLVHDAFLRLFGRYRYLRDTDHFEAYLRRTVINLSKNHHRRSGNERSFLARSRPAVASTQEPSDGDEVTQALMRLPERQRAALALRYLEDLSEQQTADAMDTTVAAVKSLTQRGSKALREQLGGRRDD
jgi:RNA polymerase sigma-70 factor (sigma-E family)